jgi:hypothetical protein
MIPATNTDQKIEIFKFAIEWTSRLYIVQIAVTAEILNNSDSVEIVITGASKDVFNAIEYFAVSDSESR